MRTDIFEQTDRFTLVSYGNGMAYAMFNKKRETSFFVQGDDATAFRKEYHDYLRAWGTEGSVYYGLTKDGVLAMLFSNYDHVAAPDHKGISDYVSSVGQVVHAIN
jgi:hypothetical protein